MAPLDGEVGVVAVGFQIANAADGIHVLGRTVAPAGLSALGVDLESSE